MLYIREPLFECGRFLIKNHEGQKSKKQQNYIFLLNFFQISILFFILELQTYKIMPFT